jgi:hypothetical protein
VSSRRTRAAVNAARDWPRQALFREQRKWQSEKPFPESAVAGYQVGSGPSLATNIRLADFKYAVEVYREHMTA